MRDFLNRYLRIIDSLPPLSFSLLILSVIAMNLLANKAVNTGLPWLVVDCGIIFSWLVFLTMDIMTHCYGPKAATTAALTAMAVNLFVSVLFLAASRVDGVWSASFVDGSEQIINDALDATFGGTWFVLLGSSIAFSASAIVNNFLNWTIGRYCGERGFATFALRSYVSTFIAQFIDNLTFALLVSRIFFGWELGLCFTCALAGAFLELLFEVFFSPVGFRISRSILARRGELEQPEEA